MTAPLQFHNPQAAQLLLLAQQLRSFEKLSDDQQHQVQQSHLLRLMRHAARYSPWWQARLSGAGFDTDKPDSAVFSRLPVLSRNEVQHAFTSLRAHPPGLQAKDVFVSASSGSTGVPVRIEKDARVYGQLYAAISWIENQWHQRDARKKIAALNVGGKDAEAASWGGVFSALGLHGKSASRALENRSLESHLHWLQSWKPDYLKCSPVVAAQLAELAIEQKVHLPFAQIISQWERITPRHRALCQQAFGAAIIDRYSCEESGWIALQCASHGKLHVLNASVLVEIVDAENNPCPPGVVGRVLLTSLQGFAMPLLRYELGDLAEWGQACECGMTLPVIERLWGRVRQQVRLPDGRMLAMAFLGDDLGQIDRIREFRIIQYKDDALEIQLVTAAALNENDKAKIQHIFNSNGLSELPLVISEVSSIAWDSGRKREEFLRRDVTLAESRCS